MCGGAASCENGLYGKMSDASSNNYDCQLLPLLMI